jgi:hypothetical protein
MAAWLQQRARCPGSAKAYARQLERRDDLGSHQVLPGAAGFLFEQRAGDDVAEIRIEILLARLSAGLTCQHDIDDPLPVVRHGRSRLQLEIV